VLCDVVEEFGRDVGLGVCVGKRGNSGGGSGRNGQRDESRREEKWIGGSARGERVGHDERLWLR
jgi:hypothetical protein